MKKIIFINTIIFLILYSLIEIFSGTLLFNKLDCNYIMCNKEFKFSNKFGLYNGDIKNYKSTYKRDEFGFRSKRKLISEIDILTVGGSTTDERFLKDEDTWSEQLETNFLKNKIDIDVVNAGIDGQSTIGHIWNFKNWFPKIKNFKTKYILFYIGINERLMENEISKYDNYLNVSNLNIYQKAIYFLKKNNGLTYRFYELIYKKYFYNETMPTSHMPREVNYKKINNKYFLKNEQKETLKKNLILLTKFTKEINAIPIYVSQKSLRGIFLNGEYYTNTEFDIYNYEKEISETINEYCKKNKIIFIDLFNEINFNNDDFYDLLHTTPKGSKKIADYLYLKLKNKINF